MKKILAPLALLLGLLAGPAMAQIPVTVTSDVPAMINQVETIAKWVEQARQMEAQIDNMKQQYESLTGNRNLGAILNDPKYRDYLPQDWQQVYDSVSSGGYAGLTGRGKSLYDASKVFDSCARVAQPDARTTCEAQAVKASADKGFALDAFDAAKSRLNQIEGLMRSINNTSDPKAIAELQARIAVEQSSIANEATKLQMYQMVAAAEEKALAQRQRETQARTWAGRGGIQPRPVTFGNGQ